MTAIVSLMTTLCTLNDQSQGLKMTTARLNLVSAGQNSMRIKMIPENSFNLCSSPNTPFFMLTSSPTVKHSEIKCVYIMLHFIQSGNVSQLDFLETNLKGAKVNL